MDYLAFLITDIDECSTNNPCAHVCHNTPGSYTCMCHLSYQLGNDGRSCFRKYQIII